MTVSGHISLTSSPLGDWGCLSVAFGWDLHGRSWTMEVKGGGLGIDDRDPSGGKAEPEAPSDAAMLANGTQMAAVLLEATQVWAELFEQDAPISGADLMEWFTAWRVRARAALGRAGAP